MILIKYYQLIKNYFLFKKIFNKKTKNIKKIINKISSIIYIINIKFYFYNIIKLFMI